MFPGIELEQLLGDDAFVEVYVTVYDSPEIWGEPIFAYHFQLCMN